MKLCDKIYALVEIALSLSNAAKTHLNNDL